jgi:hypothetical protein
VLHELKNKNVKKIKIILLVIIFISDIHKYYFY